MKIFAICTVGAVAVFLAMGYQAGLFDDGSSGSQPTPKERAKNHGPRAPYPDALVDAMRGKSVPQAADYQRTPGPHRLVILDTAGKIHAWQEKVPDEWQAESVEATELLIVVHKNYKLLIEHITYPGGAPPVSRFRHDMDLDVYAPKTGQNLARKRFVTMPRGISHIEDWGLTALGGPVQFKTVFDWIIVQSPLGFPQDPSPIITVFKGN